MIDRLISTSIHKTALKNKKSVLLLGPRQVGKSTLLKSMKPDLEINLSNESEFFEHSSNPDLLKSLVDRKKCNLIMIDEIQRIPSLLNTIQYLIDETKNTKNPLRFLISGSSARKLKRGQANLLPGRVLSYKLFGLCAQELNYDLDIKKSLQFGFLPECYFQQNSSLNSKILKTYAETYLKEEIYSESLTRNIQGFARYLNTVAAQAGKIIDYSKLSKKSKVSRTSSIRFTEILEDTLIAQRIESFQGVENIQTVKHPRIFFFDVGVLNGLLGNFIASEDRMGMLMEHFVYNQIRNSAAAMDLSCEIFYFRTHTGVEVDFIVELDGKRFAIEVKSGNIDKQDLDSLLSLRQHIKLDGCFAVSPREKLRSVDKITICNPMDMLREMGL